MPKIWKTKFSRQVIDLASGFFCFKFTNNEDLNHVLTDGPWFFNGQVLLTIPWKPNFQPLSEKIESIPIWIQFPGLPVEYLCRDIIFKLAEAIGQPINCDEISVRGTRAKYDRVCVLWNLNNNLPIGMWINSMNSRFWQAIAFENTPKLSFGCGKMGHLVEQCTEAGKATDHFEENKISSCVGKESSSQVTNHQKEKIVIENGYNSIYGPWQTVNKRKRNNGQKKGFDKDKEHDKKLETKGKEIISIDKGKENEIIMQEVNVENVMQEFQKCLSMSTKDIKMKENYTVNPFVDSDNKNFKKVTMGTDAFKAKEKLPIQVPISVEKGLEALHKKMIEMLEITVSEINEKGELNMENAWPIEQSYSQVPIQRRRRAGKERTLARLDKALMNWRWFNTYGYSLVTHLSRIGSNHRPILLTAEHSKSARKYGRKFVFEHYWMEHSELEVIIKENWTANKNELNQMEVIGQNLTSLSHILTRWTKSNINPTENELNIAKEELNILDRLDEARLCTEADIIKMRCLSNKVAALSRQLHLKWWSKARAKWMEENDKNTKFFHSLAKKLWAAEETDEMLKDWEFANDAFKEFCVEAKIPISWGNTTLVFVPNIDNPSKITDYRPIALCNVIYKILSKAIVNRIKPMIRNLISKEQCAFIEGRKMQDNILVANEIVNVIHKSKREWPYIILKIDLEKAFDRVSWRAVEKIMSFMEFPDTLKKWILVCLSSARFNCNVNGTLFENFSSAMGVRQGDPLSPYVFILMQELLSRILEEFTDKGLIKEFKYRGIKLSHLAFADDLLLTVKGNLNNCRNVMKALDIYYKLTNQKINKQKSEILFPEHCKTSIRKVVCNLTEFKEGSYPMKYLGASISP
ncbi:hypothetical protein Cni_G05989 [Canna indica]|uniref:Reverse transcriptase domain-containing protein n=1 Tax=Canna indica TaxID=4628 RepID=A0AAQ3JWC4_9LILI|nr:hypothetical protein Cni_G05989 [Canna indica]